MRPSPTTPRPSAWWSAAVLLCVAALARLYGGTAAGDDTFIYIRYVSNALLGLGYTFNPGESSYGVTSPLWAWIMTPLAALFGNSLELWRSASSVCFGIAVALVHRTVLRAGAPPSVSVLLIAAVALEPHTFRWASSGMENGLAALLVAVAFSTHVRITESGRVGATLGVVCGLMPLARPELGLLSIGLLLLHRHRAPWLAAVGSGVACLCWSYVTFDGLFPQTAPAKAIALRHTEALFGLRQSLKILASGAGAALAVLVIALGARPRGLGLVVLLSLTGVLVYLGLVNQAVSTRYATHLCFPIVLAAVVLTVRSGGRTAVAGFAMQVAVAVGVLVMVFPATRTSEHHDIEAFATKVRALTPSTARVAITEVGAFGTYSDRYIIDLVGLVDVASLEWLREHGRVRRTSELEDFLLARRADYYVDAFAGPAGIIGDKLNFVPMAEHTVRRANVARGYVVADTWRLYRISPSLSAARQSHPVRAY
jgi:hypothetical protein